MPDRLTLRKALLKRVLAGEELSDRELLAALLTYCRAKSDPAELAGELIDHFGSLSGFVECEFEELCALRGLDRDRALFLWSACRCAIRASERRRFGLTVNSPEIAEELLRPVLALREDEAHYAIYLDRDLKFLDMRPAVWIGTKPDELSEFEVLARAGELDCTNVILARNRVPGGLSPEEERRRDLNFLSAMRKLDVTLLDILILNGEDFISMAERGFFDWEVEKVRKLYHSNGREAR